jgi:hypothetical protein
MVTSVNGFVFCRPAQLRKIEQRGPVVAQLSKKGLVELEVVAPNDGTKRAYKPGSKVLVRGEVYAGEIAATRQTLPWFGEIAKVEHIDKPGDAPVLVDKAVLIDFVMVPEAQIVAVRD